eukprot:TRINITY_DN20182_c0_g1_i1.p1 TRINITY_DN20182_c0_g1~~TRINITY_DN20182_c0_g1_i1.p1  ORF type:complete len:181 (-),score=3.38 TRINITY_DN20182_c0_g1_i1:184-726(-)
MHSRECPLGVSHTSPCLGNGSIPSMVPNFPWHDDGINLGYVVTYQLQELAMRLQSDRPQHEIAHPSSLQFTVFTLASLSNFTLLQMNKIVHSHYESSSPSFAPVLSSEHRWEGETIPRPICIAALDILSLPQPFPTSSTLDSSSSQHQVLLSAMDIFRLPQPSPWSLHNSLPPPVTMNLV